MDAFAPDSPPWTEQAKHALEFCCPSCSNLPRSAKAVWINNRSPLYHADQRRTWQEFYLCECDTSWWAWNNQRPPSVLGQKIVE